MRLALDAMSLYPKPPETFEELVSPFPEEIRKNAASLRAVILQTLPDADENIYGGMKMGNALYSIGGPNDVVCGIQPTEDTCKLFVHGWEELERKGFKLQGSGKHARHMKVDSVLAENREIIAEIIRDARRACGK